MGDGDDMVTMTATITVSCCSFFSLFSLFSQSLAFRMRFATVSLYFSGFARFLGILSLKIARRSHSLIRALVS
jgi:hypothetical protein